MPSRLRQKLGHGLPARVITGTLPVPRLLLLGAALLAGGCPPPTRPTPLEPLPLRAAIDVVNTNAALRSGGLKATGPVRGQIVDAEGRTHRFDLEGKLLVIPPRHLRFDVQNALGQTEFLLGSNDEFFWAYVSRDDDTFRFGRYATPDDQRALELVIRPDWMIEALGLSTLPAETNGVEEVVQIIEPERQELLFISYNAEGRPLVRKEYWLSRRPPRLTERVTYRDALGSELMHAALSDYRRAAETGLLLPYRIRMDWPARDSWIEFRIGRWQERSDLTTDLPGFRMAAPESLTEQYRRVIDVDTGQTPGRAASEAPAENP
jgi:hypothetical protein